MEARYLPQTPDDISSFYIQATESIQDRWPRTLKHGDTFGLFDTFGDVIKPGLTPGGLFFRDTRHLSELQLLLNGHRPLLLSSGVEDDNVLLNVDLSNPDIYYGDAIVLPREVLHLRRSRFLWDDIFREQIMVRNFDTRPHNFWLSMNFGADFIDLFEVRGMKRARRGKSSLTVSGGNTLLFRYAGLDAVQRHTEVQLNPAPRKLSPCQAIYSLFLAPGEKSVIDLAIRCGDSKLAGSFASSFRSARRRAKRVAGLGSRLTSSNAFANRMLRRSGADISMLITDTACGPYPYAGTPWFSTAFGRDGLITALEVLWLEPELARGVLCYLAANQATELDPRSEAEPGKILHETRACEMAALGEVPFGRYYGSIDSTPLFVLLAARYFERTGDERTIRALWPNIEAALVWIDSYGDRDGDGFVEYHRVSENGLVNQGWKDSTDSIMHSDGSLAVGPIALCEVQAYVYAAKQGGAILARQLGQDARAAALAAEAEALRRNFERQFWCEDLAMYALALDGQKRCCRVKSSNAAQTLFCGIASADRAAQIADRLMSREMFSGWGVRTLSSDAPRYNPMSYHNGSVWPHDNALIALGLARYGHMPQVSAIFEGLFGAANHMAMMRLPELFCGFARGRSAGPTLYPVACAPQAWASVSPFAFLEASLGLTLERESGRIILDHPHLPPFMEKVRIEGLSLGNARADLRIENADGRVEVTIDRHEGDLAMHVLQ